LKNLFPKKYFEKIIEAILFICGWSSVIIVGFIIYFLFSEGLKIFGTESIERGQIIAVNSQNKVNKISPVQLKKIFDQEVTNWKDIGGNDGEIKIVTMNDLSTYFTDEQMGTEMQHLPTLIDSLTQAEKEIIFTFNETYKLPSFKGKVLEVEKVGLGNFFGGDEWFPTAMPAALMGIKPLLLGTLWVSLLAILIAMPLGLAVAIYIAEIANNRTRLILKPAIELLAGIPSVVYGFFGLVVLVPLIQKTFNLPVGESGLAGGIILSFMALPTIITISEDFIRSTPLAMKEASLALGASHWQTIFKVILPYAASGISTAMILGIGRAVGETMAVLMVTGNAAVIPHSIFEPLRTIPATIAAELGEATQGGLHYKALFALGCILFVFTFTINTIVSYLKPKR
jgi:phosphate transport system permease protein